MNKLILSSAAFAVLSLLGVAKAISPEDATAFLDNAHLLAESITTAHFDVWLSLHSKSYGSQAEYNGRLDIFRQNAKIVALHNMAFEKGWTLYSMSLKGEFADLSNEEFQAKYLMESQNCSATTHPSSGSIETFLKSNPHMEMGSYFLKDKASVDWRTKGIITPVKNQAHCGSCWTFSTSGCLEAHTCLAHHREASDVSSFDCTSWTGLAEQQLLDCSWNYDNNGCNGGLPSHAYEYLKDAGGMYLEEDYPYVANSTDRTCAKHCCAKKAQVAEVFNITARNEQDLVHAVQSLGPVSVAYQVSPDFRLYNHGVYDSFNATTNQTMCKDDEMSVNHAVVAVGFGQIEKDDEVVPYYIIRNSWGTSWGMEGYFWMKRDVNLCGVSDCASFPIVPAANNNFMVSGIDTETSKVWLRGRD